MRRGQQSFGYFDQFTDFISAFNDVKTGFRGLPGFLFEVWNEVLLPLGAIGHHSRDRGFVAQRHAFSGDGGSGGGRGGRTGGSKGIHRTASWRGSKGAVGGAGQCRHVVAVDAAVAGGIETCHSLVAGQCFVGSIL